MQVKAKDFFLLPNLLSLSRIFISIAIAWLIKINTDIGNIWIIPITIVGVLTDILDGYFSRKFNQVTELGIILDPICDKIGMAIVMIALIVFRDFPLPLVVFLVYRDIFILVAGLIGIKKTSEPVMANYFGKVNTVVVSMAIMLFMFNLQGVVYEIFVIIGYVTILISGLSYMLVGEKILFDKTWQRLTFRLTVTLLSSAVLYSMLGYNFI